MVGSKLSSFFRLEASFGAGLSMGQTHDKLLQWASQVLLVHVIYTHRYTLCVLCLGESVPDDISFQHLIGTAEAVVACPRNPRSSPPKTPEALKL